MENTKNKILFIIGSTRKTSFNRQLSEVVEKIILENDDIKPYNVEVEYLDFSDVPFFNQDYEFPTPESVKNVRKKVSEASGLWIFTPEYNHSYPGYLKNLIDWLSRPLVKNDFSAGTTAHGKKVTISSAAGRAAGINSTNKLRELLDFVGMNLYFETLVGISIEPNSFATGILSIKDNDMYRLEKQAKGFVEFISKQSDKEL